MPIHDWTRVSAGGFHNFHQDWTIEIYRALNRGVLPAGYMAFTDLKVNGVEPDAVTIRTDPVAPSGGLAVADTPPQVRQAARAESEVGTYARRGNRVLIRHNYGPVVAVIEVISPGNKNSRHAVRAFTSKAVEFLRSGVSVLFVDLFPPTRRDPDGLHRLVWEELSDEPFDPRPPDKPLSIAAIDAGDPLTVYVEPLAVGDLLPDGPLFLAPGRYVNVPFEATYRAAWEVTPTPIRDEVQPPA